MNGNGTRFLLYTLAACALAFHEPVRADDLKDYYERQKAEVAPSFKAPELGSEITIVLLAGQKRTGILMKLTGDEVGIMAEAGSLTYKRNALHESTRAQLFAEDYANAIAIERTRVYKDELYAQQVQKEQGGMHEGSISVTSKVDKKFDKAEENDEKENKQTGDTITTTTTTKTTTETQQLAVTIANNTTHSDTYTLAWYFFAEPLEGGNATVHDSDSKTITVEARKRVRHDIVSKPCSVVETTVQRELPSVNHTPDPKITKSGQQNAGYVVLLKYGDTILDAKASSSTYLSKEWLDKL
ncbi:MAG: hypothetical protein K9M54_03150 [Kiritimatiellales bacterium]|nr:hypothetical protein [Kiritimatiellales bacterium]MCF7864636.1 hypothetical protein [Kiritimatiellales bacterium]